MGQMANKLMKRQTFKVSSHQGNGNQNLNELQHPTHWDWRKITMIKKTQPFGKLMGRLEASYTAWENAKWSSHFGKQWGSS